MFFGRNLRLAGLAFLLWSLAYNLTAPLLPLFARQLGASSVQIGLVSSVGLGGALALVVPVSLLSDHVGRRAALLTGWSLSAAGVLLMTLARSWWQLLPGVFLSQAVAAALPALNTLALEESEPSQYARTFALLYAAGPLGLLGGSAVGGYLAESFGLRAAVAVAGACCVAAAASVLPLAPSPVLPAVPGAPPRSRALSLPAIAFALLAAAGFLLIALPGQFIVPFLKEVGNQSILAAGLYTALLAGGQLAWSLLFAAWPRSGTWLRLGRGESALTLPTATLWAVALCLAANGTFGLIFPLANSVVWAAGLLLRGSQYTLQSLGSSLLGDVVAPGPARTTRMTFFSAVLGLGGLASPVLAGWLYGVHAAYPFWASGLGCFLGLAALAAALRLLPRGTPAAGGPAGPLHSRT